MSACWSVIQQCHSVMMHLGFLSGKWRGKHAILVASKPFKKGPYSLLLCLIHCAGWDASVISSSADCETRVTWFFFSSRRNHALFPQKYSEFPNKYVIRCSFWVFIRKLCKYTYEMLEAFFCFWKDIDNVSGSQRLSVCIEYVCAAPHGWVSNAVETLYWLIYFKFKLELKLF